LKDSNEVFSKLVGCYDSEFDQVCASSLWALPSILTISFL
jgi:hypothetical protein